MSDKRREANIIIAKHFAGDPAGACRAQAAVQEIFAEQPAQGEAVTPADVQRVIDRLMASDPNFDDCEEAADMLRRFAAATPAPSAPDGWGLAKFQHKWESCETQCECKVCGTVFTAAPERSA